MFSKSNPSPILAKPKKLVHAPWRLRFKAWRNGGQLIYIANRFGDDIKITYSQLFEDPWGTLSIRANSDWRLRSPQYGDLKLLPNGKVVDQLSRYFKWCPYDENERVAMNLTWNEPTS
jgi:hypothetical protein